jgi:hypothetical protein
MSTTVGSQVKDLEFADKWNWTGSLGSIDANYEPTHYHSEYGLW